MSFLKRIKMVPILGIAMLTIGGMIACESHEHTFSTDWSYSETLHWHEATCDHEEKVDVEAHVFDDACDPDCNVCGYIRTPAEHIYLNDCDKTCEVCGETREVGSHDYDHEHDENCNVCGDTRTVDAHTYTNDCDPTCDACGEIREVGEHVYDNACDTTCNECGKVRLVAGHIYDDDCDTTCNICQEPREVGEHQYCDGCDDTCSECGHVREVDGHVFDNDCDTVCNECGHERTVTGHAYDNGCDDTCNECGHVREIKGHVFDNDCDTTCSECGHVREVEDHHYCDGCDDTCSECGHVREVDGHIFDNDCDTTCNTCGHERVVEEHVWSDDYKYDETVEEHWHYCTVCDIRGPRESCVFDQKVSTDAYLHIPATDTTKGIYYYSCVCGRASEDSTYELDKELSGIVYANRGKDYDGLPAEIEYRIKSDGEVTIEFKKTSESESSFTTVVPKDAGVYNVRLTVKETPIYRGATIEGFYTINPLEIEVDLADYNLVVTQDTNKPALITLDETVTGILPGETADVNVLPVDDSTLGAQDLAIDEVESLNPNYVVTATSDTARFIVRRAGETYFTVQNPIEVTTGLRVLGTVIGGDLVKGDKLLLSSLDLVIEFSNPRNALNEDVGGIIPSGTLGYITIGSEDEALLATYKANIKKGTVLTVNNDIEYQDTYLATFYFRTNEEGGRTTPIVWTGYKPYYSLYGDEGKHAIIKAAYGLSNDNNFVYPGETVTFLIQFVNNYEDNTPVKTVIKPGISEIQMLEKISNTENRISAVGTISYQTNALETNFVETGFGLVSDGVTKDSFTYLVDLTDKAAVSAFKFFSTENGLNNGSTELSNITAKFKVIVLEITDTGVVEIPGELQGDGGFIKEGESSKFLFESNRKFVIHIELLQDITSFCFGMV